MTVFDVLSLLCGLALFLYGMEVMGDSLKKSAGSSLKTILGKMTSNPVKGFLLGLQFETILKDNLYWDMARHANKMAQKLQNGLKEKGYPLMIESPTNQIFPVVPNELLPKLNEICLYEFWSKADETHTNIRFVTTFATTEEEVDALLAAM